MKKILVVFTGGTICTTIKNGEMNTNSKATMALIDFYNKSNSFCKTDVSLENGKEFNILSENMTVHKWNELIAYFQEILKGQLEYDGIIVAHGTDTLAYSTAMFSLLLKGVKIPVIFVSSNKPIMNEDGTKNTCSNGCENFIASIECIYNNLPAGVWATYKNPEDNKMYLHKGENLVQCAIYDDNFYSKGAYDITNIKNVQFLAEEAISCEMPIMKMGDQKLKDCILKVNPYMGLNYNMYNLQNVKAVLHGTYHSGTSCVEGEESSILYFIDKCAGNNVPFYYSPSKKSGESSIYASVSYIENHIANGQKPYFCYGDTEELTYCKLLYAYSLNLSQKEIDNLLNN